MKVLLGSGNAYRNGWVNVDFHNQPYDIKHDLNIFPYPFESDSVEILHMLHVLEHLDSPVDVMNEIHRICKNGAEVLIEVPHAQSSGSWTNITHVNQFGLGSFNPFQSGYPEKYSNVEFKIINKEFQCLGPLLWNSCNLTKLLFEYWVSKWWPGFINLKFVMEVIK